MNKLVKQMLKLQDKGMAADTMMMPMPPVDISIGSKETISVDET